MRRISAATVAAAISWNVGVLAIVGSALWLTSNPWVLLGLTFSMGWRTSRINAECPVCGHCFIAVKKDEEE